MHTQLHPWLIPSYRPTGQSTELTLRYAEEAMKKREIDAKITEIAQNKVFANQRGNFLSDHAREKLASKTFSTKEQTAERLALHLLFVPKVTESDIASFAKVVDCCYTIDLVLARIGYTSYAECSDLVELFSQFLGKDGFKFLSDLIDMHTLKPFTESALLTFLSGYVALFQWVNNPEKDCRGPAAEQVKKIREEFKYFCAERKAIDSAQDRGNFLMMKLTADEKFMRDLKEMTDPTTDTIAISRAHLTKLIELAGNSRNCFEFSPPACVAEEPAVIEQLKRYGFEKDPGFSYTFARK